MVTARNAILAALLLAGSGCQRDAASPGATAAWRTERSTEGDTLVVRTLGAASPNAELSLTPEISIGTETGGPAEILSIVTFVTPAPDGGVIFYEDRAKELRHFDSAGKFVRSIGRVGSGPGEFGNGRLTGVEFMPDGRLAVWNDLRGIHVFSQNDEYIETWPLPPHLPRNAPSSGTVDTAGYLHSVFWIDSPFFPDSVTNDGTRHQSRISIRSAPDGTVLDTILMLPIPRPRMVQLELPSPFPNGRPLMVFQSIPLVPWGTFTYTRNGHWVYAGTDRYGFTSIPRPPGQIMRVESDLLPVAAAVEEREFHRAQVERDARRRDKTRVIRLDEIPETKPFIKALKADRDSRVWVELHQPANKVVSDAVTQWVEPLVYDVFEPNGEFLGRVRFPERSTFATAKGDKVWIIQRDSLDVPQLVRYSLGRKR